MQILDKEDKKAKLAEQLRKNLVRRKANKTSDIKTDKNKQNSTSGGEF